MAEQRQSITLSLPPDLAAKLERLSATQGASTEDTIVWELRRALSGLGSPSAAAAEGQEGGPAGRPFSGRGLLHRKESARLYTTAPVIAIVEGLLHGQATVGDALKHGNFGLGTLDLLDGEVVVLDGVPYQQEADGGCHVIGPDAKTPYLAVTNWMPEQCTTVHLTCRMSWKELLHALEAHLPSPNIFYAIRLEGRFESLRVRAVRKQTRDRKLTEVTKEQVVFELGACAGTLVGFWSPPFEGFRLAVPEFHLHFISDDRSKGGHVLQADLEEGKALIMPVRHTDTDLPEAPGVLLGSALGESSQARQAAEAELREAEGA